MPPLQMLKDAAMALKGVITGKTARQKQSVKSKVTEDFGLNLSTTVGWDQDNKVSRRQD